MPSGPADKHLEPGDVLVRVNGTVSYLDYIFLIGIVFFRLPRPIENCDMFLLQKRNAWFRD